MIIIQSKICRICKEDLDISNFAIRDTKTDLRRTECRKCLCDYYKKDWGKNRERNKARKRKNYQDKKEIILEKSHLYYRKNRDKIRLQKRVYARNKRASTPERKIKANISAKIYQTLGQGKNNVSLTKYLEYTIAELKNHLESMFEPWMSWDNYGRYSINWIDNDPATWTWQIDHIIPQSKFSFTSLESDDFKKCWALNNLRPYSSKQNLLDGNRR